MEAANYSLDALTLLKFVQTLTKNANISILKDVRMYCLRFCAVLEEVQVIDVYQICKLNAAKSMIGAFPITDGVLIKILA